MCAPHIDDDDDRDHDHDHHVAARTLAIVPAVLVRRGRLKCIFHGGAEKCSDRYVIAFRHSKQRGVYFLSLSHRVRRLRRLRDVLGSIPSTYTRPHTHREIYILADMSQDTTAAMARARTAQLVSARSASERIYRTKIVLFFLRVSGQHVRFELSVLEQAVKEIEMYFNDLLKLIIKCNHVFFGWPWPERVFCVSRFFLLNYDSDSMGHRAQSERNS